jgi:diamine N-acetyltransferase
MNLSIRSCIASDARALSLLGQATMLATYAETVPVEDILQHCEGPHSVAQYADYLSRPDHRLWLAELETTSAPVGYAVMGPSELPVDPQAGDAELKRIYVLQGFQGGGLGARLISTVVDSARSAGYRRLLLSVFSRNENAIGFYGHQGFTQVGTHRFPVGTNAYDDFILAKTL